MNINFTDLLPPERSRKLRQEYFLRLATLAVGMSAVLVLIAALFLVPTYFKLRIETRDASAELANLRAGLDSADETEFSKRLSALSQNAATLSVLPVPAPAAGVVRQLLTVSRAGITISNFVYAPGNAKTPGTVAITGKAATREALRTYQLALQAAPFLASVDIPVSAYAKDSDITFTSVITLAP